MTRKALFQIRNSITLGSVLLVGCAAWTTPGPASRPYFPTASQQDFEHFQSLAKKQEKLNLTCRDSNSCEEVYFTRAMLGLYESREVADQHFEKVIAVAPKSQLAASSKVWIELLRKPADPGPKSWPEAILTAPAIADTNTSLVRTLDRLVRDLLVKQAVVQQLRESEAEDAETVETLQRELAERDRKIESLQSKKDSPRASVEPALVQHMQKQLAERDRRIEELSAQLEALKRIDQEMREKVRPIRPPLTTVPVPVPETTP